MEVAASSVNKVTTRASSSSEKNRVTVRDREPGETMKTNKINGEAGRVTNEVTRRGESEIEASINCKTNT
jgi:hypothetical protein